VTFYPFLKNLEVEVAEERARIVVILVREPLLSVSMSKVSPAAISDGSLTVTIKEVRR